MSKKEDFEVLLLGAGQPFKRSKRHKQTKKFETEQLLQSTNPLTTDPSMDLDTINEIIDIEEIPISTEAPSTSDSSYVEMSAAEKLKSQTLSPTKGIAMPPNAESTSKASKKRKVRRDSGTSSEEERWLNAIECGRLQQEDDQLKKIKDPKLMTARQRAMYERSIDKDQTLANDSLRALPTGYKKKILTTEDIQKAALKSQTRKRVADEKREKDKKRTIDRLLKKQETKATKGNKNKPIKVTVPLISYRDSIVDGAFLTFPARDQYLLKAHGPIGSPRAVPCGVCTTNTKRYNCAQTNVPLCSFKCYKVNIRSIEKIVC